MSPLVIGRVRLARVSCNHRAPFRTQSCHIVTSLRAVPCDVTPSTVYKTPLPLSLRRPPPPKDHCQRNGQWNSPAPTSSHSSCSTTTWPAESPRQTPPPPRHQPKLEDYLPPDPVVWLEESPHHLPHNRFGKVNPQSDHQLRESRF